MSPASLSAFKFVAAKENDSGMAPIYPVNRHVKQKLINLINLAIDSFLDQWDIVPKEIMEKYRLLHDKKLFKNASPKWS